MMFHMPRRVRIHLDGVPLHLVQRGHNREPCFFGEEDYQSYLYWLGEALKKERCALHAYALMTNHVHLLVTPERAESIPRLIISMPRSKPRPDKGGRPSHAAGRVCSAMNPLRVMRGKANWGCDAEY